MHHVPVISQTTGQAELDLFLILFTFAATLLSRFRIIIFVLEIVVFIIRLAQWSLRNKDDVEGIDDHLVSYIHRLKHAEGLIFDVIFHPLRHKKGKEAKAMEELGIG